MMKFIILCMLGLGLAARVPSGTLICTGYGEVLNQSKLIQVNEARISEADLRNGERLYLDFYSIMAYKIEVDEGKFVGQFTEEDEGPRKEGKVSTGSFAQLGKIKKHIEYSMTDSASGNSFWRLSVKCRIDEN